MDASPDADEASVEPDDRLVVTRRSLYVRVWSEPVQSVAKEFRISGAGLRKTCVRNEVPVPPRGYWAKKRNGHPVEQPPLPYAEYEDELVHFDRVACVRNFYRRRFPWRTPPKAWEWAPAAAKTARKPRAARSSAGQPLPESADDRGETRVAHARDEAPVPIAPASGTPEPRPPGPQLDAAAHATPSPALRQAKAVGELRPLFELCKAGMLFEVQDWIAAGRPIDPPPVKGRKFVTPLRIAVEQGFHSLVRVLLEAGARMDTPGGGSPIYEAISMHRLDLVRLFVDRGFDATSVSMRWVFAEWAPDIMEYFIEQGADITSENAVACGLCERIRPVLGILKQHGERLPRLKQQADFALRHHSKEGDAKWVSLMLWAGADPYAPGSADPFRDSDPEWGSSAVVYAAIYGHYDLFRIKKFCPRPDHPDTHDAFRFACRDGRTDIAERFLRMGVVMNDLPDDGCSALQYVFECFGDAEFYTRPSMVAAAAFLMSRGAKWRPTAEDITSVRRSLMRAKADDVFALLKAITRHEGCRRYDMLALLRTERIREHLASAERQLKRLVLSLPESPA